MSKITELLNKLEKVRSEKLESVELQRYADVAKLRDSELKILSQLDKLLKNENH